MLKNRRMLHVGIACSDVEKDAKWYQDVLGFHVIGCFPHNGHNCYFLKNGDTVYEVYQKDTLNPLVQGKVDHIAFESLDVEADYKAAKEAGYELWANGIQELPQFFEKGFRCFKLISPCGEQIEFGQIL